MTLRFLSISSTDSNSEKATTFPVVGSALRKCSSMRRLPFCTRWKQRPSHCEEVDAVVLGVKRILFVRTVVRIVIDAAQHQTFRQGAEEQVLVRVRPSARRNGVHFTVDGSHLMLDRALLESIDVGHLHGRIQGGLLCEQGGIDNGDLVIGVDSASHECRRILTSTPLNRNLSCRNRSTCRRPIMSTTRLRTMFSRRATNPALAVGPSSMSTASMRVAVSVCHS